MLWLAFLLLNAVSFARAEFGLDVDEQGNFVGGGKIKTRHEEEGVATQQIAAQIMQARALADREAEQRSKNPLSDLPHYFDDKKVPQDKADKIKRTIKEFLGGLDAEIKIKKPFQEGPAAFDKNNIVSVSIMESILPEERIIGLKLRDRGQFDDYVLSDIKDNDGYKIRHDSVGALWQKLRGIKTQYPDAKINDVGAAKRSVIIRLWDTRGFAIVFDNALNMSPGKEGVIESFNFFGADPVRLDRIIPTDTPSDVYKATNGQETRELKSISPSDNSGVYWSFDNTVVKPLL